jgi:hypothetical protein
VIFSSGLAKDFVLFPRTVSLVLTVGPAGRVQIFADHGVRARRRQDREYLHFASNEADCEKLGNMERLHRYALSQ